MLVRGWSMLQEERPRNQVYSAQFIQRRLSRDSIATYCYLMEEHQRKQSLTPLREERYDEKQQTLLEHRKF